MDFQYILQVLLRNQLRLRHLRFDDRMLNLMGYERLVLHYLLQEQAL